MENNLESVEDGKTASTLRKDELSEIDALTEILTELDKFVSKMFQNESNDGVRSINWFDVKVTNSLTNIISNSCKALIVSARNQSKSDTEYLDYMHPLTQRIFAGAINLLDYDEPSWAEVKPEHLDFGLEIVAAENHILYGFRSSGKPLKETFRGFPMIEND